MHQVQIQNNKYNTLYKMSSLTSNLQQIYTIKTQIKSAIGTQSDVFADYPAYIQAMSGGTEVSGYTSITANGNYDVASYAYAYVDVPTGSTVSGYAYITENGDFDISTYAMVNVDVPTSGGGALDNVYFESLTDVGVPIDWSDNGDGTFSYTFEYDEENTDGYGYLNTYVTYDGDDYQMALESFSATDLLDGNNEISTTGEFNKIISRGSDYTETGVGDINNYYSTWNLSITVTIDMTSPITGATFEWEFSGTPNE